MIVLVKFIACSAFLLLLFQIFLAKEKSFQLNRWILLALIPAAMIIPFLNIPIFLPQQNPVQIDYLPIDASHLPRLTQSYTSAQSRCLHRYKRWFCLCCIASAVLFFLLPKKNKSHEPAVNIAGQKKCASVQAQFTEQLLILSEKVSSLLV